MPRRKRRSALFHCQWPPARKVYSFMPSRISAAMQRQQSLASIIWRRGPPPAGASFLSPTLARASPLALSFSSPAFLLLSLLRSANRRQQRAPFLHLHHWRWPPRAIFATAQNELAERCFSRLQANWPAEARLQALREAILADYLLAGA